MRFLVVICLGIVSGSAELILLQGPEDVALRSLESLEIFAAGPMRKGPQGWTADSRWTPREDG